MMKKIIKKNWPYAAGFIAGGIGGYLYWYHVGCSSGNCPITSSPLLSILWAAVLGALLADIFVPKKKQPVEQ